MAKYAKEREAMAYRIYICDSLYYQADGKRLTMRYSDLIKPKTVDNRTGDEIAADIIGRLGLKVG